jgi:hypothetical protein
MTLLADNSPEVDLPDEHAHSGKIKSVETISPLPWSKAGLAILPGVYIVVVSWGNVNRSIEPWLP